MSDPDLAEDKGSLIEFKEKMKELLKQNKVSSVTNEELLEEIWRVLKPYPSKETSLKNEQVLKDKLEAYRNRNPKLRQDTYEDLRYLIEKIAPKETISSQQSDTIRDTVSKFLEQNMNEIPLKETTSPKQSDSISEKISKVLEEREGSYGKQPNDKNIKLVLENLLEETSNRIDYLEKLKDKKIALLKSIV